MSTLRGMLRMLVPSVTVFFSGGCIMVLELVATRLVAQDLGSSLYTWTSILGVALVGLSIGGYVGGRLAERFDARRTLAVLFGLSSAACVGVVVLNHAVGHSLWLWQMDWPVHVFAHVSLVFLAPALLLGTTGPVVAGMALDRESGVGRTVGALCAWAAAGAIVAVFLTGFFLIPRYGTIAIIWLIGAALLAMGLAYWISCLALYLWTLVFAALVTMGMAPADWARNAGVSAGLRESHDPNLVLYEDETAYHRLQVRRLSQRPDRRVLWQDHLERGVIVMEDATHLQGFHTKVFAGLTQGLAADGAPQAVMVIGGGGYALPQHLQVAWPGAEIEVVAIDPGVTRAATEALGLDPNTTIASVHRDAREYIIQFIRGTPGETPERRYDFIYADAADDAGGGFHLVTKECNDEIAQLLADDGAYMIAVTDVYESGRFLGAVIGTLEATFSRVYVIGDPTQLPSQRGTFVVVAAARAFDPEELLGQYNEHLPFRILNASEIEQLKTQADHRLLTDDYAPVETLLAPVVRQGATERLARRYFWQARVLGRQGGHQASAAQYRRAVALDPLLSVPAWTAIARMHVERGDFEGAVEAFQAAIDFQIDRGLERTAIAPVHMQLGILLRRMGRSDEERRHLEQAVRWFRADLQQNPNSAVNWIWLAETLSLLGRFDEASEAFERAVTLAPEEVTSYEKWAKVLELQQRYNEAVDVLRRQLALLKQQGRREEALQVGQYIEILEYRNVKRKP